MVRYFVREKQRKIAQERVKSLLDLAEKAFSKNPDRADHYVSLARRVAMKARIKIPSELRKTFCKHCYKFLQPGANCRVRTKNKKVVYYCLHCKKYMRFPYIREKRKKTSS